MSKTSFLRARTTIVRDSSSSTTNNAAGAGVAQHATNTEGVGTANHPPSSLAIVPLEIDSPENSFISTLQDSSLSSPASITELEYAGLLRLDGGTNVGTSASLAAATASKASSSSSSHLHYGAVAYTVMSHLAHWIGRTTHRCWMVLLASILIEIYATALTKVASDTANPTKLCVALSMYIVSLLGFAASLPKIEVGIAYAVWSALGTAVVSIVGICVFGERCDGMKLVCLGLIVVGVVGLNLNDKHH